ncbi:MAG: branched-chain amino acid ABC transporter permease [Actinobacteria bacterium]|nr:branched-chain amino acid ABC transporter permease [Actinomycetota bacterium]
MARAARSTGGVAPPSSTPLRRALSAGAVACLVLLVLALPVLLETRTYELARAAEYAIAILGLVVLVGFTGQISLGHGAFMAIGGYTSGVLMFHTGVAGALTIPLAGVVAGLIGFFFGFPALRLSGVYLALATFALAVAVPSILKRFEGLTGGSGGLVLDVLAPPGRLHVRPERWLYYLTVSIALVLFALTWLLLRGRAGRALRAIRDGEVAAVSFGVNVALYKALAFGLSAAYAGVAGSLLVIDSGFVNPDTFPIELSIRILVGAVVAGLTTLGAIPLGALFIEFLPIYSQQVSQQAPAVIYGAALILIMVLLPSGAAGLIRRLLSPVIGRL